MFRCHHSLSALDRIMRLLLVEDNEQLGQLLANDLQQLGYDVDCRTTAAAARKALMKTLLPQVLDGKLIGLAVTTPERSSSAPELPTMRECAPELARFDVSSWFGVLLPKACPPEIVTALNLQVKAMLEREEIKKNIATMGAHAHADYGTPEQFSEFVRPKP
jgi:tripartite-type tricarboxylate transporter receptor subunit TctC